MSSSVTAVIPAFDSERWVASAIESVLSQTYSDIECIVVDDGSTDGTRDIASSYGSRVRLVTRDNGGDAAARNTGIEAAAGSYVAFLDSDDVWLPRKTELQVALLEERHEVAMVTSAAHVADEDLNFTGVVRPAPTDFLAPTLLLEKPFLSAVGSSGMIRTDVARELGGFDTRLRASSDWAFACKVASACDVVTLPQPLAIYRQHAAQIHRRLDDVERDVRLVLDEAFVPGGWGESIPGGKRRAMANLFVSLAATRLRGGQRGEAIRSVLRALWLRPDRVVSAIWRRARPGGPWDLGGPASLTMRDV